MEKTKFYELLVKARHDEATLVFVIDKIMPMINKYSQGKNKEIDEDLKSILIEYSIKVIKNKKFADKLAKEKKYKEAVEVIMNRNPMGETCGLICPDKFCMSACTRKNLDFAINIPKVQATLMKNYRTFAEKTRPDAKIAKNKIIFKTKFIFYTCSFIAR